MANQGITRRGRQYLKDVTANGGPTDLNVLQSLVTEMLLALGEKPDRNGLLKTPERMAKALAFAGGTGRAIRRVRRNRESR